MTRGDPAALERAAEASAIAARLAREASDAETFSVGASGQQVVNPLFASAKGWTSEARSWLTALGLSPASRAGVESVRLPPKSDIASFLERKDR